VSNLNTPDELNNELMWWLNYYPW